MQVGVACNPNTPAAVLEALATAPDPTVRAVVAYQPEHARSGVRSVGHRPGTGVRARVAHTRTRLHE